MQTMQDHIVARIKRLGAGKAFSAKDFLDIASRGHIPACYSPVYPWIDYPSGLFCGAKYCPTTSAFALYRGSLQ